MKVRLYRDRKVTLWERDRFEIEAISKEHALKRLLELCKNQHEFNEDYGFLETETIWDTQNNMTLEENKGYSTEEIFYNLNEDPIWKNGK